MALQRKAGSIFILVDVVVAIDRRRNFPNYHDCVCYVRGFDELPTVNQQLTLLPGVRSLGCCKKFHGCRNSVNGWFLRAKLPPVILAGRDVVYSFKRSRFVPRRRAHIRPCASSVEQSHSSRCLSISKSGSTSVESNARTANASLVLCAKWNDGAARAQ